MNKVRIFKILNITSGGLHCWCDSNVGRIRKPNSSVPQFFWDKFSGKLKWYQLFFSWLKYIIKYE